METGSARRQALEFKRWLLRSVAADPRITRDARGRVARELDALESGGDAGDWEERRRRRGAQPYALSCAFAGQLARLEAVRLALDRAAVARPLEARFLALVGAALRESAEGALDVLFSCFPLVELLCSLEPNAPTMASRDEGPIGDGRPPHSEHRGRLLELGQQCSAWFTTEGELALALSRLGG